MTEGEKRCGLSSFLPMSCRGRAEAFARRLHSRLRSLGSQDGGDHTSESSWLTANEISPSSVTSLQPRHSLDHDSFMDFAMFNATGSPEEAELTEPELSKFITNSKDNLIPNYDECDCVIAKRNSVDSDSSDGVYYDPENNENDSGFINNHVNGKLSRDTIDETDHSESTLYCLSPDINEIAECSKSGISQEQFSEISLPTDTLENCLSRSISHIKSPESTSNHATNNLDQNTISTSPECLEAHESKCNPELKSKLNPELDFLNESISRNISDEHMRTECVGPSNSNSSTNQNTMLDQNGLSTLFRSLSEEPIILSLEYGCSTHECSSDRDSDPTSIPSDFILRNLSASCTPNHKSETIKDTNLDLHTCSSKCNLSEEPVTILTECVTPTSNHVSTISFEAISDSSSQDTSEDLSSGCTSNDESTTYPDKSLDQVDCPCTSRNLSDPTISIDTDTISNQAKFFSDSTLSSLSINPNEESVPSLEFASFNRDTVSNFSSFPSQSTLSGLSRNISEDPIFQSSEVTVSSRSEDEVPPSQSSECTMSSLSPSEYGTPLASLSDLTTTPPKLEFEKTSGWSLTYEPKIPNNNNLFSAIDLESLKCCKPEETYCSQLNIQHNLTVECPNPVVEISTLEVQESNEINSSNAEVKIEDTLHLQVLDDEMYDLEERMPRIRRCSSLKTGKTPPGTPGRKKIVRFADVLGLDLADVRTFMDEIPRIPISAYDDLSDLDLSNSSETSNSLATKNPTKTLVALFEQPGGEPNFLDKVRERQVCLENAVLQDPVTLCICGTIRVRNLDFNKSVHLRYTTDAWKNFADLQASYIENSCDGFSDKFTFLLYVHTLTIGQRLEFAVRFQCHGSQYWDNNAGENYCFQCMPTKTNLYLPLSMPDENNWAGAAFYYDNTISLHTNVQELVTQNLVVKAHTQMSGEMLTALIILLFACLLIFIQKICYFTFT